ncbi:MAG TPA: hypothetical protein VGF30_01565 [Bacteroidia bacterium]
MKGLTYISFLLVISYGTPSCSDEKERIDAEKIVEVMSKVNAPPLKEKKTPEEEKIDSFFTAYEKLYNDALSSEKIDVFTTAECFSACFIEAIPGGVTCGTNDKEFKKRIKQGYAFYKSVGTQSMHIVDKEITVLNKYHIMVR